MLSVNGLNNRIYIIILFALFSVNLMAHETENGRAIAFDRGLTSASEPFAPSGNPALLTLKDRFRFHVEYINSSRSSYNLSMIYPVSPFTNFGISYSSQDRDEIKNISQGVFRVIQKNQTFLFSLGHNSFVRWGQHFEINFAMNRFSTITSGSLQAPPYDNDQILQCSYRLGLFKELSSTFSIGLLTPSVLQFEYHTFDQKNKAADTKFSFFHERKGPMGALRWTPDSRFNFVLSNRSKYGENDLQLASEVVMKRLIWTTAIYNKQHSDNPGYVLGLGSDLKGLYFFSVFDFSENEFRLAASFAPEKAGELIEIQNMIMPSSVLYPYHLKHGDNSSFVSLQLKNKTDNLVDVTVTLSGRSLPQASTSLTIDVSAFTTVDIPIPAGLEHIVAGTYSYTLDVTAHYRGRQHIRRTLTFEIKDKHLWAGDIKDLLYFLSPDHEDIVAESRRFVTHYANECQPGKIEAIAERIYNHIRTFSYIKDPKSWHENQDWVQYPVETLQSRSGDCEDFAVLFVSLLQSVGIDAALAEYRIPDSDEGHVLVLFDSQKSVADIINENGNLQNYIIRKKSVQESTCYVPLELTLNNLSFVESRKYAIAIYHKYAVEQKGFANGWFHIIDARSISETPINSRN